MSRGLETLKLLVDFIKEFDLGNVDKLFVDGSYDIIEEELKVLEIIKENLVVSFDDESLNDCPYLMIGIKVRDDKLVVIYETYDREKIDLLKEVLL